MLLAAATVTALSLGAEPPSAPSKPGASAAVGQSAVAPGGPGTAPVPRGSGAPPGATTRPEWLTAVDDQFEVAGIPEHWIPYDGPYDSGARNCAVPSHASVGGGSLRLQIAWESAGRCGAGWYTAGLQIKREFGGVDQRISLRWRVTGTNLDAVRSYRNIPMRWVADQDYPWYEGETNYCEGSTLDLCTTYLHYRDTETEVKQVHEVDLTQWHTWLIEHRHNRVTIWVDGELLWDYSGSPMTVPDAFRVTVLQQECQYRGCPASELAGNTETIEIDWIKIETAS